MDVAAFSGDNFDAKDWINKALKSSEPGQSKVGVGGWTCPCFIKMPTEIVGWMQGRSDGFP